MRISSHLSISQTGLLLVCLPIIFEACFTAVLLHLLKEAEYYGWKESNFRYLTTQSYDLSIIAFEAVGELAAYSMVRTEEHKLRFRRLSDRAAKQISKIKTIMVDAGPDDNSQKAFALMARRFYGFNTQAENMFEQTSDSLNNVVLAQEVKILLSDLLVASRQFMASLSEVSPQYTKSALATRNAVLWFVGCGMLLHVILMIWLGLIFGKEISHRLNTLVDNTKRLREGRELASRLSGADEIAYLDQEFHDMAIELQAANLRRRELVGMISHDLRTPITSINLFLGRLKYQAASGSLDDSLEKQITKVEGTARFLIDLINDFLDLEKIDAGKLHVEVSDVDVADVINASVESLEPLAADKNVQLKVIGGAESPIRADKARLSQVLINLISNAVRYSSSGSNVEIRVKQSERETRIEIADSGPGIPEADRQAVFEPFHQLEGAPKKGSTGLGLAICRKLCQIQGAEIGVDSVHGSGSTFWIVFKN